MSRFVTLIPEVEIFETTERNFVMTATDSATAAFVLREAEAAGYAFASNGIELVTKTPSGRGFRARIRCMA